VHGGVEVLLDLELQVKGCRRLQSYGMSGFTKNANERRHNKQQQRNPAEQNNKQVRGKQYLEMVLLACMTTNIFFCQRTKHVTSKCAMENWPDTG